MSAELHGADGTLYAETAAAWVEVDVADRVATIGRVGADEWVEGEDFTFGFCGDDGKLDTDADLGLSEDEWQALELALREVVQSSGVRLPSEPRASR